LNHEILVGGLEHEFYFSIQLGIIPTDELIFFRGVGIPPTRQDKVEEAHPLD
jgi:hypothetical protein